MYNIYMYMYTCIMYNVYWLFVVIEQKHLKIELSRA